nr:hypothetical protein [Perilla mosaic virus]
MDLPTSNSCTSRMGQMTMNKEDEIKLKKILKNNFIPSSIGRLADLFLSLRGCKESWLLSTYADECETKEEFFDLLELYLEIVEAKVETCLNIEEMKTVTRRMRRQESYSDRFYVLCIKYNFPAADPEFDDNGILVFDKVDYYKSALLSMRGKEDLERRYKYLIENWKHEMDYEYGKGFKEDYEYLQVDRCDKTLYGKSSIHDKRRLAAACHAELLNTYNPYVMDKVCKSEGLFNEVMLIDH